MRQRLTYTKETYKTREEWLSGRSIGGSSAAAILNLNPWLTKIELFNAMLWGAPEKADNPVLAYGRELEPIIRKEYIADHPQYKVRPPRGYEMYRDKENPMLTATVDGLLVELATGRKGILEIKTHDVRSARDAMEWEQGRIPNNYIVQMLHYLLVLSDHEFCEFVARLRFFDNDGVGFVPSKAVTIYKHIERSEVEEQIKFLKMQEFIFTKNIELGIPPDGEVKF